MYRLYGRIRCQKTSPECSQNEDASVLKVRPVIISGSRTLKDATNEAIRDWSAIRKTLIIWSVPWWGLDPYPDMVARFQSVIKWRDSSQLSEKQAEVIRIKSSPVSGRKQCCRAFYHFLDNPSVTLFVAVAAGKALIPDTVATSRVGSVRHNSWKQDLVDADRWRPDHRTFTYLGRPGLSGYRAPARHLFETGRLTMLHATWMMRHWCGPLNLHGWKGIILPWNQRTPWCPSQNEIC